MGGVTFLAVVMTAVLVLHNLHPHGASRLTLPNASHKSAFSNCNDIIKLAQTVEGDSQSITNHPSGVRITYSRKRPGPIFDIGPGDAAGSAALPKHFPCVRSVDIEHQPSR